MELRFRGDHRTDTEDQRAVHRDIWEMVKCPYWVFSRAVIRVCVWENYVPKTLGKNHAKEWEGQMFSAQRSWGDWKFPFITMVTPVSVKCLCHRMGKFKHRNTSLCWIYRPGCNTKCHRSILQMSSENANRPESAFRRKGTTFTGCVVDNFLITILELYREAKWFGQKS